MGAIKRTEGDQDITRDSRVDLTALGLYYKMLTLPKQWDFSLKGLVKIVPESLSTIRRTWKRLVKLGYCKREKIVGQDGTTEYQYIILTPRGYQKTGLDFDTQSKSFNKGSILRTQAEADVDAWLSEGEEIEGPKTWSPKETTEMVQPSLLSRSEPVKVETVVDPIPKVSHTIMYRVCYSTESEQQALILTSEQRGRVASVLGKLRDAGANLNDIYKFEQWWKQDWRSKQKGTNLYNPPRPEQVLENWFTAMRSYKADPEPNTNGSGPDIDIDQLTAKMLQRATERRQGTQ